MASVRYKFVVCATCGAEIDRVEFDEGVPAPAVSAVADALGLDEASATQLVADRLPGAELSSEQRAGSLADAIAAGAVPDRDESTYTCPNGHTGAVVSDANPTPIVSTTIAKEAVK